MANTIGYMAGRDAVTRSRIAEMSPDQTSSNLTFSPQIAKVIAEVLVNGKTTIDVDGKAVTDSCQTSIGAFGGLGTNENLRLQEDIVEAFFQAGATTFLQLLVSRINTSNTKASVTPCTKLSQDTSNVTLQTLMIRVKEAILAAIKQLHGSQKVEESESVAAVTARGVLGNLGLASTAGHRMDVNIMSQVVGAIVAQVVSNLSHAELTNYLLDMKTITALCTFGIGPWVVLQFILSFASNPNVPFVTQAYARVACALLAAVSMSKLATDMTTTSSSDGLATRLKAISLKIVTMVTSSADNNNTGPIAAIMAQAQANQKLAKKLQATGDTLRQRTGVAGNMQTTHRANKRDVVSSRRIFYAWLAAYIIVLVASIGLIFTNRISAFLLLAGATLALIVLVVVLSWLVSRFGGNSMSPAGDLLSPLASEPSAW